MSYILDAIKKSEAERGHGSIPSLQTVHSSSLNYKTDNQQIWPYILIGLLLLNFAGLIFYFSNNPDNESFNKASSTKAVSTQSPSYAEPIQRRNLPATPAIHSTSTDRQSVEVIPDAADLETESQYNNDSATSPIQTTIASEVLDIEDLPEYIKQNIPPMNFTGHVYSSSRIQRSLIVNGNFMEEGDALNSNILLSEITNRGAIFDYQGTFFSVNVLTGWNANQ